MPKAERLDLPLPTPRFAWALAALICAIAALTLAHPALSGGFLVNPRSDQYIAGFAFRDFAAQTLRTQGHFPLWNPYLFGGLPYVDAMHGDIFYPTFLLRMILPTDVAMTWGMISHFWLAGLAAYALFRAHGLSFYASLVGGLAYMMSGQVAGLVSPGHDGKLFITALLPITLLVIRFGVRDGRAWAWGVLAIIVGLGVLTPHPQLLQYLLIASGAYALWLAYMEGGEGAPSRAVATRRLGLALGAVVVGFAIGAIQFMPLRQYTPWSPRAAGHDWETAVSYSMPPEEIFNWILPQFSGILDNYWGRNHIHFHSEYLGLPVLLLAAAAFGTADARKRKWMWFATGLFGVSAIWALGGYTPWFYHIVATLVPGTMYFRAPSTIMFESAFAVAALAALGTDRILEGKIGRTFLIGAAIAVGVLTLISVSGALSNAFSFLAPNDSRFDNNKTEVTLGAWRMFFFAALMLTVIGATAMKKIPANLAAWALAALVVADLWSIERQYWQFSPRAAQIYAADAAIARIKNDTISGRVLTLQDPSRGDFRDPFLRGDALMSNNIRMLTGYHGNELARYQELDGSTEAQGLEKRLVNSPAFPAITNLRWVYSNIDDLAKSVPSKFTMVLGPVKNAIGNDIWLYRVTGENPPAWIVPAIMKADDPQTLEFILHTNFPATSVAVIDDKSPTPAQQLTAVPAPLPISAKLTHSEPGAIDIELSAAAPDKSALVVSENFYPGWKATVDGQPATVDRADYAIMAVPLKAGARKITLRFTDDAYTRGKMITLFALALAIAAAVGGFIIDRRRARG